MPMATGGRLPPARPASRRPLQGRRPHPAGAHRLGKTAPNLAASLGTGSCGVAMARHPASRLPAVAREQPSTTVVDGGGSMHDSPGAAGVEGRAPAPAPPSARLPPEAVRTPHYCRRPETLRTALAAPPRCRVKWYYLWALVVTSLLVSY